MDKERLIEKLHLDDIFGEWFEIYKHNEDYIVWSELEILCISKDFKQKWSFSARDILVRRDNKPAIELLENVIIVYDWLGWCYRLDYNGSLLGEMRLYTEWR